MPPDDGGTMDTTTGLDARLVRDADIGAELEWTLGALADESIAAPRLRVWLYRDAAVVFGRGQPLPAAAAPGLPLVQRPSGGGAVLVGPWMIGTSLVLPAHHAVAGSILDAYRWFGTVHAHWLRGMGVAAEAERGGATRPHWACFAGRGPWEVEAGGRKIVGLAQARKRHAVLLVAGTLVDAVPWKRLAAALQRAPGDAAELERTTVSAAELLGRSVDAPAWARALLRMLERRVVDATPAPAASEGAVR
jgi:lipoate-protein ligase A